MKKILERKPSSFWRALTVFGAVIALSAVAFSGQNSGGGPAAVFTTDHTLAVNLNQYSSKDEVYLNGGPVGSCQTNLPHGDYRFEVRGTGSNANPENLLSSDDAANRIITIGEIGGNSGILSTSGDHILLPKPGCPGLFAVQLIPFADALKNDEYRAVVVKLDGKKTVKSDQFKIENENPLSLSIKTQVGVVEAFGMPIHDAGELLDLDLPDFVPVVTWGGEEQGYVVDHATVNLVTNVAADALSTPWSVTVQDQAIVTVSGAPPLGTVEFTLYNNDTCEPGTGTLWNDPDAPTPVPYWTPMVAPNTYSSPLSKAFTFSAGGAWAFSARYVSAGPNDYGSVEDLGCEMWPIPTITTQISAGDVVVTDNSTNPVTVGAVLEGTAIKDTAFINTNDTLEVIPPSTDDAQSTVRFDLFPNLTCTGDPDPAGSETVVLNGGAQTESASTTGLGSPASGSYLSFRAVFTSADPNKVPGVFDNLCEPLYVVKPLTVSKTAKTHFNRTYSWTINKTVDGGASSTKEAATPGFSNQFAYEVTVSATSVDSDWTVTGTITVNNPNPWSVTLEDGDITDSMPGATTCTVDSGELTVPAKADETDGTAAVNYTCTGFTSAPSSDNTATVAYSDHGLEITATTTLANADFDAANITHVNNQVSVSDDKYPGLDLSADASGGQSEFTASYTATISSPAIGGGGCTEVVNTATIVGTEQSASATAISCTKVGTKTQGYWQTHTTYTTQIFGNQSWTIGSKTIDSASKVFSAFYSDIPKKSDKKARTALDHARMQMLQQWVAAKLNCSPGHDMGCSAATQTLLNDAAAAWSGTDASAILSYAAQLDAYNNSNDTWQLPGGSATAKDSQNTAKTTLSYWDVLP